MKKVLVIGSGGREHSICIYLSKSEAVKQIYVLPGNAGTQMQNKCQNLNLNLSDFEKLSDWCLDNKIDLVVVGPEEPLIRGISDKLELKGIRCFGPKSYAAQLEGSKEFGKIVMKECNIPTAEYSAFLDAESALKFLKNASDKMRVIKIDGIAAGKGVIVAKTFQEAEEAVLEMFYKENSKIGVTNTKILIEELLDGPEISVLAFTDGKNVCCFPPCQDHKRVFDGDKGPNTGGMGAYCPYDFIDNHILKLIKEEIIQKVIDHMRTRGNPYQGIIYAGIMLTANGPYVLEFNCRFGDPETQVLLPHLKSDLYALMAACTDNEGLSKFNVEFYDNCYSLCVVLTSGGYPGSYKKGYPITGLDSNNEHVHFIHAGTELDGRNGKVVTNGGRVLGVVAIHKELKFCYNLTMDVIRNINFQNCYYRNDIGYHALKKKFWKKLTYSAAGVNIAAGDELVHRIKSISERTKRTGNISEIGSFGAMFDLKPCGYTDPLLVSGTDGVGTKLKIAVLMNKHDTIGQDLVAMCVNDILCHGAEPLYFLDYYASGKLNLELSSSLITGIADACRLAGCSLIGGETAEMPGIYSKGDYDLAGFAVGAVEKVNLLPKLERIKPGDKIIGLASNGLHSNGFSLVRKIISSFPLKEVAPFGDTYLSLGEFLLAPTTIYVKPILQLLHESRFRDHIHSIAHITGGGLPENLPRSLPLQMKAIINVNNFTIPPVFKWLWKYSSQDMNDFSKTFNLGIGMVLIVSEEISSEIIDFLAEKCDFVSKVIGIVAPCKYKTETRVVLENLDSSITENIKLVSDLSIKPKTRVGVLISGSGTNLEALLKYSNDSIECSYEIVVVISNVDNVKGIEIAKIYGIPVKVISHKGFVNRALFDSELDSVLSNEQFNCQLICLAGFMRILGKDFTNKWFGKIINIHPSLLPSFKGAHAHREVLKTGVKISGATVHFVIENVDAGGIIFQEATNVFPYDTEDSLAERIKTEIEHNIYPKALHCVANGECFLDSENRVQWNRNAII